MGELIFIGLDGGTIFKGQCGSRVAEEVRAQWMLARQREVNKLVDATSFLTTQNNVTIYLPDVSAVAYEIR